MSEDAGSDMKARMREDLRAAMKDRRTIEAKVIRELIAAIDNAEAPPIHATQSWPGHRFLDGSAEIERRRLSRSQVRAVLLAEIEERERSAMELERVKVMDRARAVRDQILLAKAYIEFE